MQMIEKWSTVERVNHWLLLIGITTAIITGLPLYDVAAFGFLSALRQLRLPFGITIHLIGATLILVAAIIHVVYRATTRRPTEIMFGLKDIKDLTTIGLHWFGLSKEYPKLGLHHPGQKMIYWGAAVAGVALAGASGFLLWVPEVAPSLHTFAILAHDVAFVLILTLIAGHFILAITHPPCLTAMLVNGKMPVSFMQHHHPEWAERKGLLEKTAAPN